MSVIKGCQEGKGTPKLVEVKCPKCGEYVEVFVKMGGAIGKTGTLVASALTFSISSHIINRLARGISIPVPNVAF